MTEMLLFAFCSLALIALGFALLANARLHLTKSDLERSLESLSDRLWEAKEGSERTERYLEAQGDVIVRRTQSGRITYANEAYCALIGQQRAALIGHNSALSLVSQGEFATREDGTRLHDQCVQTPNGPRWIAWREVLIRDINGNLETLSVGRDVTDRTETEHALAIARDQAEDANRAKSRFLATVSHEIRTPLNGILGMSGLLSGTKLKPEQAAYVKAVKTSGETLLTLIEEVLDFSKIESGRLDLDIRPFSVRSLVEEVVELLAPRAHAKGLEIAGSADDRLPAWVNGDAARLRQILLNLAGNAVKFTDKGGFAITAEAGIWPNEVTFRVSDTGIGIAPEAHARVFEEFEQADNGATRRFGGTGLGLAISKRIVERMNGRIGVESAPGRGSTFHFSVNLPAAESSDPELILPDLAGSAILIVSPSIVEAPQMAAQLSRWNASHCLVSDHEVALAMMEERPWRALLADGALGTKALKALAAAAKTIEQRIVIITPGERGRLRALHRQGFNAYLVKPVRAASLATQLTQGDICPPLVPAAAPLDRLAQRIGLSILVAEDNDINALLARALLVKLGHHPTLAGTGVIAVESWQAANSAGAPYDVILMDVQMPEMDGLEAARRIRAAEKKKKLPRTRIIALTANAYAHDRDACIAAGMDGFLVKPFDRDRLMQALEASPLAV